MRQFRAAGESVQVTDAAGYQQVNPVDYKLDGHTISVHFFYVKNDQATLDITASGIAFASGSALVGEALLGPMGAVAGAVLGLGVGIASEMLSPKNEVPSSSKKITSTSKTSKTS